MKKVILGVTIALLGAAPAHAAKGDHWCRQGDPPIKASKRTSCPFAGNMVTGWANTGQQDYVKLRVYSPTTKKKYPIECWIIAKGAKIKCMGKPGTGIRAVFSSDI